MTKQDLKKKEELTPKVFNQIKNRFFGNAEFNSFRAPVLAGTEKPYLDEMSYSENIWDEIGEKAPWEEKEIKLGHKKKAEITFERLEKETNPKKFIQIFQAIYNNIYINLESGLTPRVTGYTQSLIGKLLYSLEESFEYYGYSDFLKKEKVADRDTRIVDLKTALLSNKREPYEYKIPSKYKIEYVGNIFNEKESGRIILNGFKSKKLEKFILENKKEDNFLKEKKDNSIFKHPIFSGIIATVTGGIILFLILGK